MQTNRLCKTDYSIFQGSLYRVSLKKLLKIENMRSNQMELEFTFSFDLKNPCQKNHVKKTKLHAISDMQPDFTPASFVPHMLALALSFPSSTQNTLLPVLVSYSFSYPPVLFSKARIRSIPSDGRFRLSLSLSR